jgi:hypothetical protein
MTSVRTPPGSIASTYARQSGLAEGQFVGAREVAAMLGVTRQRVGQIVRDDRTFPVSATTISGGRLWYTPGIEIWIAAHRPGAPSHATSRFGDEAAEILRAAEATALSSGDGYVGNLHFWLVIAEAVPRSLVRDVFGSLGVDRAELLRATGLSRARPSTPSAARRMNPHIQRLLLHAREAAEALDRPVTALDTAIAFIDGDERYRRHRSDPLLDYVERRGLDVGELRRRLEAVSIDPRLMATFEPRALTKRRPSFRRPRLPRGLAFAPNPLGHDPSTLSSGAAFAVRRDGRSLVIDGEQWFFRIDGDGFYVRTPDGHPVGYRYRVHPPPRRGRGNPRPVNGFIEVLPMPPEDVADWPDGRFERET